MGLLDFFKKREPSKDNRVAHTTYDAFFTFFFKQNQTTNSIGTHIKDGIDLKRMMIHVVLALQLCYVVGAYNIGHQHFLAIGQHNGLLDAVHLKLVYGLMQILPILVVTNVTGLAIEFYFAAKRGHSVEEGFIVSGALIPLIMPPDIPLWMLALAVAFAVLLGKEAFGGTGMNVLNVALLARAFIFFAYPTEISGDGPWIAGLEEMQLAGGATTFVAEYSWYHLMFNGLFEAGGLSTFEPGLAVVDGYSGATPLALAYNEGWAVANSVSGEIEAGVQAKYSTAQMIMGGIPGCIGETCKPIIILGGVILLVTRVASWRIMLSSAIGAVAMGLIFNQVVDTGIIEESSKFFGLMSTPFWHHLLIGGFAFGTVFMATDPVSAAQTNKGKWIYGFLIGFISILIRVFNPAYPEGVMLAILLMNVFAPTIDHYVIQGNVKMRMKRLKVKNA